MMRASLRLWEHFGSLTCKYTCCVVANHSTAGVGPKPETNSLSSLKQHTNSLLLDMLIDPNTDTQLKPFVYKECYYRVPSMSPSDSLQLLRLFIDSRVPTHICLKAAQSIVSKGSALTGAERLELLNILYDSNVKIIAYNGVIKYILADLDPNLVSTEFLFKMWEKSVDRHSSIHPAFLIRELLRVSVIRIESLTDNQLARMLTLSRGTKAFSGDHIDVIHSNLITHRRHRHDLMSALILVLYNTLKYNTNAIESYFEVLHESLKSGNISPASITLASVMAKQNFFENKIFEQLEPYVIDFYQKKQLSKGGAFTYLYACIIADYFPKKFIQLFATPERINYLIREVKTTPFLKSGVELCTVVDYARVKGVDLDLSDEVQRLLRKLTYNFCRKSWEFHCNELNPWENRAKDLIRRNFTLYSSWPTRAGYFIDGCLFFDEDGNPFPLDSSASILLEGRKSCTTFDKSGLEVKPVRSNIDFDVIWDVVNNENILKDVPNKIIIEFNGPYHFMSPSKKRANSFRIEGATMLRRKYLQASGWQYIGMPFFQFEQKISTYVFCDSISRLVKHIVKFNRSDNK